MPIRTAIQPTSAKEWRTNAIKTVTLPSGNVARLRRPSMLNLARNGGKQGVPDLLSGIVAQAMEGRKVQLSGDDVPNIAQMLDTLCREAFIEPQVAKEGQPATDNVIDVADIEDQDKMWLVNWIMEGDGAAAATFPERAPASVAHVPNSDSNGDKTIAADGATQ